MMPFSDLQAQQTLNVTQHHSPRQVDAINSSVVLLLILAYPSFFILGAVSYCKYRAIARHRQIEALEKLLQLSCKK